MCSNGNKCSKLENAELDRDTYFLALTSCYRLAHAASNQLIMNSIAESAPEVVAELERKPKWRYIA